LEHNERTEIKEEYQLGLKLSSGRFRSLKSFRTNSDLKQSEGEAEG